MSAQPAPSFVASSTLVSPVVAQANVVFLPHPTEAKPSLFGILVVDLLALGIAFLGSQVTDDEGIAGSIVMLVMTGAVAGHVVYAHFRRAFR